MDIEELDSEKLAELETMLYCQVFHSKETEDCKPTNTTANTIPMEKNINEKHNVPSTKPRYFEKPAKRVISSGNSDKSWHAEGAEKKNQQQNNPIATSPIQNNITINHYVYNVPGWAYDSDKEDNSEVVNELKKKLKRKRPPKKVRAEIKKELAKRTRAKSKRDRSHVIFISDDESSESCQVIAHDGADVDLTNKGSTTSAPSYNDDDVLYVPTETSQTIIDLDSDDESTEQQVNEQGIVTDVYNNREYIESGDDTDANNAQKETNIERASNDNPKVIKNVRSNESHESNDFLDADVVQDSQDSFDFQLHGSEYNQCSGGSKRRSSSEQFVKPPDPPGDAPATAEHHETESESTSSTTTGTDRNCSNEFSLKNIVFQEVDFPKADIFADNDLHNFEKFITPQRGNQESNEQHSKEARTPRTSKTRTPKTVHTPQPRTASARKDRANAKSPANSKVRAEQERDQEVKENSDDSEESSSESEFESSEGQRRRLPELSLMLEPEESERDENEQEKAETNVEEVGDDSQAPTEPVSSNVDPVAEETQDNDESSAQTTETSVTSKRGNKSKKAKNKKSRMSEQQPVTQKKTPKKRKRGKKKTAAPPQPEVPAVVVDSPISVDVPSSNDGDDSDDDVELIEKPVEVIPLIDSDEEVEDIQLSIKQVEDTKKDNADMQVNAADEMADKATEDAPVDLDVVYANLTNDPSKWQISRKDHPTLLALEQRPRSKGPRCNRCRRFGHMALKCTEKPEPPRCYLCGAGDHTEPRCPNKICLNCGNKGDYTTNYCYRCFKYRDLQCNICSQPGHLASVCPDLWRRYHITTEPGPIKVTAGPQLKPRDQQWCSGCAAQGHLEHECYYYGRQYPPALPYIVNYDNVLAPDQVQNAASAPSTPKDVTNHDAENTITDTPNTAKKRTPRQKRSDRSEQNAKNSGEDTRAAQRRSKGIDAPRNVRTTTTPQNAFRNENTSMIPTDRMHDFGEPPRIPPEDRLFTLAGYRIQPRGIPEMRLFDIAGYGIPPTGANQPGPGHSTVNAFGTIHSAMSAPGTVDRGANLPVSVHSPVNVLGPIPGPLDTPGFPITHPVWANEGLFPMDRNVGRPPAAIPSLLSLQFQPRFDVGSFDQLPTSEELNWLENRNPEGHLEEIPREGEEDLRHILDRKSGQQLKKFFLTAPLVELQLFVGKELAKLKRVRTTNTEGLRNAIYSAVTNHRAIKLNGNPTEKQRRKEIQGKDLYRRANMLLFGVHRLHFGHKHMSALFRLMSEDKNNVPRTQRMAYYLAHRYIFCDELKEGIKYGKLLWQVAKNTRKQKSKRQQKHGTKQQQTQSKKQNSKQQQKQKPKQQQKQNPKQQQKQR
ncbi:unnamed protein product [Acanthoscelides obtectus]|uniref:Zinc finger CCHC domain-containing protein 7 n=1 Tax=Acanthoscelides obtectus TaxID=200917 RepID=A0A9P0KD35_ACAOB|nr:unnamed protein product [Acanthoscelides obtectus]CAK1677209.1 Zinc finger CCHC domain-containing protein 7 [Acanthoscelides obtectus]